MCSYSVAWECILERWLTATVTLRNTCCDPSADLPRFDKFLPMVSSSRIPPGESCNYDELSTNSKIVRTITDSDWVQMTIKILWYSENDIVTIRMIDTQNIFFFMTLNNFKNKSTASKKCNKQLEHFYPNVKYSSPLFLKNKFWQMIMIESIVMKGLPLTIDRRFVNHLWFVNSDCLFHFSWIDCRLNTNP